MTDYLCPNCGPIAEYKITSKRKEMDIFGECVIEICAGCETEVCDFTPLVDAYKALKAENEALKSTLQKIANPIKEFVRQAEESGNKINGQMAVQLANDAQLLKCWARNSLTKPPNSADRED